MIYIAHKDKDKSHLDLFDLLDALELDEKNYGVDLVLVEALHGLKVDVQHAVLVLERD